VIAEAGPVSINDATIFSFAPEYSTGTDVDLFAATATAASATLLSQAGASRSKTGISWNASPHQQVLGFEFVLRRDTLANSFAKSDAFNLDFADRAVHQRFEARAFQNTESGLSREELLFV